MDNAWSQDLMGQWVHFTHRLMKTKQNNQVRWYRMAFNGTGMVIGRRWVKNGRVTHEAEYDEFGGRSYSYAVFEELETVPCLAVVRNDRENHIYIPLDCFEVLVDEAE